MNKPVYAMTFADLAERIDADMELHPQRQANLKSSMRRFLAMVGWVDTMEASFPRVRRALVTALPAKAEVSKGTWANTRSDLKFALGRYGAPTRAPLRKDLSPAWAKLREITDPDPKFTRGLSNFMHFCSSRGISPDSVNDVVMTHYHEDLVARSLKRNPDRLYRHACKLWSEAVHEFEDWPRHSVTLPAFRKTISLPWNIFPASFLEAIERYKAHMSGADILRADALDKPLEESTIHTNVEAFRRLASAIVRSGKPVSEMTSLQALLTEENLRTGLDAYEKHNGTIRCASIHNMIGSLISLADKHLCADPKTLSLLRGLRRRIYKRKRGMTEKNVDRLRQFASTDNVRAFITLGDSLIEEARALGKIKKRALRMQTALMHEIMLVAPLRAKNLTELHLQHNFRYAGKGVRRTIFLVLSSDETKNDREMEFYLPHHLVQLFDTYLKLHRPRLLNGPDKGWLFPGNDGEHKNQVTVGDQLIKSVKRLTGIQINPHLYRHIAAFLYLQEHPEGYETVRLLLGHKSVDTTIMFYAGFSDTNARRHYADMLTARRFSDRVLKP
jgi:integrase